MPDRERTLMDKFWGWYWDSWIYRKYQYSWLYRIRWKVTHWWRKDHWIKTNLKCDYHDKVGLMQDGLFTLVDDYVRRDREDAFATVDYDNDGPLMREVKEKIIKILYFYNVREPQLQKESDELLHLCFGPVEMQFLDCDREGYKELKMVYKGELTDKVREEKIKEMRDLEDQIHKETQEMLHLCVDVRPYLWT